MGLVQAFHLAALLCHFTMLFSTHATSSAFSLKLIPLFSPESPLYPGNLSQSERIHKMLEISKARTISMGSLSSNQDSLADTNEFYLPIKNQQDYFFSVEVHIGTPKKSQFLLFDMGSSLTWTQCKPCIRCFHQATAVFNAHDSSTYSEILCGDPACQGSSFGCENGKCVYKKRYHGGDSTRGLACRETFAFPKVSNMFTLVPNMIFGCSNNNTEFSPFAGKLSGILGFNASPLSLISQLKTKVQGLFSYCLARDMATTTSIIRFGPDADVRRRSGMQTTPIILSNVKPQFYLKLLEISIGSRVVRFAPGAFDIQTNGTGGFIIDTGTPFTSIKMGYAYDKLMDEYDNVLKKLGCKRVTSASHEFEYCYRYKSSFKAYPPLTFHLEIADYKVEPENMYSIQEKKGYFCVAIHGGEKYSILGAMQQQNMLMVYDLNKHKLRFGSQNCASY